MRDPRTLFDRRRFLQLLLALPAALAAATRFGFADEAVAAEALFAATSPRRPCATAPS